MSKECAVFMNFLCSHCANSSRVRYQSALKHSLEKSTYLPPPPISQSQTHSYTLLSYFLTYYDRHCPVVFLCCPICLDTFIPLSYFYLAASQLHSHTYLHSVCMSVCSSPHTGNWCKYLGGPPVSSTAAVSCGLK